LLVTEAFQFADSVLLNAVQGISDLINVTGMINCDFSDVRTVMGERGLALMGTGRASGEDRAQKAMEEAISNPLLEDMSIHGARGVLVNITSGPGMTLREVEEAMQPIRDEGHPDAQIIYGQVIDESMDEELRITVIATGLLQPGRQPAKESTGYLSNADTPLRRPQEILPETGEPADFAGAEVETSPAAEGEAAEQLAPTFDEELDVPAFIRRRAASGDRRPRPN